MSNFVNPETNFLALDGDAFRAPVGTAILDASALNALVTPWLPYGAVETGFTIATTQDRTEKTVWNKPGAPYRIITRNEIKKITFKAPDRSEATILTQQRGGAITQVGGSAETQTVTITGAPTGGSFTLTYAGQTTGAIAFNAAASAVQTAMEALSNLEPGDVTVTGAGGGPWTVVFSAALGDVAQMTRTNSLTGGTSPDVVIATTVAGVSPVVFKWSDNPTGEDEFAFVQDTRDGLKHIRWLFPRVSLDSVPTETHDGDDLGPEFTLTVLAPETGDTYYKWSNFDPYVTL